MIFIRKNAEPPELTELRSKAIERGLSPKDAYTTLKGTKKEKVRNSLLHEQGQLCAYCMCRIPRYDVDAEIVKIDLIDTLNLNCVSSPLVSEREASLSELLIDMDSIEECDLADYCKSRLSAFQSETDNKTPYQGILIWYLQSMLDALNAISD